MDINSIVLLVLFGIEYVFTQRNGAANLTDEINVIEVLNDCKCVYNYQCDPSGFIRLNGEGLFDVRFGEKSSEDEVSENTPNCPGGKYEGEIKCCKLTIGQSTPPTTSTTTKRSGSTLKNSTSPKCGRPRHIIDVRVLNPDADTTPIEGEFPWLAAIFRKNKWTGQWNFNKLGSLIHPKVILTGAHVILNSKPNELKVIVNAKIERPEVGFNSRQERDVEEIIKHPDYNSGALWNDVALLILKEPYNITNSYEETLNTICLKSSVSYENKRCYIASWEKTSNGNSGNAILKKVDLPTHSPEKCQELLRKTRLGESYIFHESFMCAGGEEGKDACIGDGGSPLVCPTEERNAFYQVGLVVYGVQCGKKDVPGVYTNVGHFYSWISERLTEHNLKIDHI
ncbi:phenoloxidase-activating factor 2-like [Anthonomus grandis grandis]|uniref:phenoloxidase-activating factor 2-like n=1 Tax=Anthonomus grandis grandis TaxID=2921223 RepID=UPI002166674E|nr:phenoloxidase-activating factor 2-like [Anthonomus grandis grandis]